MDKFVYRTGEGFNIEAEEELEEGCIIEYASEDSKESVVKEVYGVSGMNIMLCNERERTVIKVKKVEENA